MWLKDVKLARWGRFSLDDVLTLIVEENKIKEITFVFYEKCELIDPIGYKDIDPQDGILKYEKVQLHGFRGGLKKLRREAIRGDYLVGITSKVFIKGKMDIPAHLFFLDFCTEIKDNEDAYKEIEGLVATLEITPGFIIESGRSYHFYSSSVVSPEHREEILKRAVESWIVDADWVELQLRRGHSVLRVSQNSNKTFFPVPVEVLGYQLVHPAQTYLFQEFAPKWPIERIPQIQG